MTTQIGMVIFPGMTALDFAGPLEVFGRIPDAQVHVLAKVLDPVKTDIGFHEIPTMRMADAPRLDLLFVGGGPGSTAMMEDEEMVDFFRRRAPDAQWITSVCTGALILGAAGLLRGYRAATHWAAMGVLPLLGATPVDERVVVDRNRITGGGVTAGIDFGLVVAKELRGEEVARKIQLVMEYDPAPPFNGGSPRTEAADIVKTVRDQLSPGTQARAAAAGRIASRNGWPTPTREGGAHVPDA
ncbi:MAG: DJ-1/PfpI family protein [Burkholderiales bacterium]|nr:MAG: DJ-1/PfpI family protein [Burkholderiales bacterium]